MFYASSRRTESNPRTIAAIRAQRLREQERQRSGPHKQPIRAKAIPLAVVKPVVSAKAPAPIVVIVTELDISDKMNRRWQQFLQAVVTDVPTPAVRIYRPDFERILLRVCRVFRITPQDVTSPSRRTDLILPRQAIYYWAFRLTALGYRAIGDKIGGRDHSTVVYGVEAYRKKRAQMGRCLRSARRRS